MKPIEDVGAVNRSRKPIQLPVMDPGAVLDPVSCAGGLALINDRGDGNPRPALALSNGASWDRYLTEPEVRALIATTASQTVISPQVDIAREVARVLPALMPPERAPLVVEHKPMGLPAPATDDLAAMADAILQMHETINALSHRVFTLEQELDSLKSVSVVTGIKAA